MITCRTVLQPGRTAVGYGRPGPGSCFIFHLPLISEGTRVPATGLNANTAVISSKARNVNNMLQNRYICRLRYGETLLRKTYIGRIVNSQHVIIRYQIIVLNRCMATANHLTAISTHQHIRVVACAIRLASPDAEAKAAIIGSETTYIIESEIINLQRSGLTNFQIEQLHQSTIRIAHSGGIQSRRKSGV